MLESQARSLNADNDAGLTAHLESDGELPASDNISR